MFSEEKRRIKFTDVPAREVNLDSLPSFESLKLQEVIELSIWKKLPIEIWGILPTKTKYYLCRLRDTSDVAVIYFFPFEVKKLTDDIIEVQSHKSSQLAEHLHNRIFSSPSREGVLLDNRHNIGIYFCYFVIGKSTLADYIEKLNKGRGFERANIITACKDLIADLFEYHTENVILNSIGLEDIIVTQSGHFHVIQNAKSTSLRLDQLTSQARQTQRYPSPFTIPQFNSISEESPELVTHNPFKSDVYNLGKIISHMCEFSDMSDQTEIYLHECMVLEVNQKTGELWIQTIPSLLRVMLDVEEERRFSSMELMMYIGQMGWLQKKIEVPYERFFEKKISKVNASTNQVKIQYQQEQMVFEGEVIQDLFDKNDPIGKQIKGHIRLDIKRGMLYFNGEKVYEGQFNNNRPQGKCKLALKGNWTFQGEINGFKLHGPCVIYWAQEVAYKGDIYKNILISKQPNSLKIQQHFSYSAEKYSSFEYKIFCRPLQHSFHSSHFNLTSITQDTIIVNLLKYLNLKERVKEIQLKEGIFNNTYSVYLIDILDIVLESEANDGHINLELAFQRGFGRIAFSSLLNEKIEKLDLSNCKITDEDFKTILLCCPFKLQSLLQINFSNTLIRDNSLITFISEKRQLCRINISNTKISDHGLTMLLHSDVQKLTELRIGGLKVENYSVVGRFFTHDKCRNLQLLDVEGLKIDSVTLHKLLQGHELGLRSLNLARCSMLTDRSLEEFFGEFNWGNIKQLVLSHNNIGSRVLEVICAMNKSCSQLVTLNLSGCLNIKPVALKLIFRTDRFPSLRNIDVSSTLMNDDCLKDIYEQTNKIVRLNIASCSSITTTGLRTFLLNCDMPDLESLDISRLKVKPSMLSALHGTHLNLKEFSCFAVEGEDLEYLSALKYADHIRLESSQLQKNSLDYFGWVKKLLNLKALSLWVDQQVAVSLVKQYEDSLVLVFKNIDPQFEPLKPAIIQTISKQTLDFIQLSRCELFEKVQNLDLSKEFNLDERRLGSVFNTPFAKNIKVINMSESCLGSKFLQALLLNRLLPRANHIQLRRLNISNIKDNIDEAMCKLTRSGTFDKLQVLDLSWTNIHNCVVQALSSCECNSLKQLSLNNTPYITDHALQALANSKISQPLALLDLKYTNITNRSLQSLANSKHCTKLCYLYLSGCDNLNMSGLKKLLSSQAAASLIILDLGWLKLDNSLFEVLAANSKMMLKKLTLTGVKNCWEHLDKYLQSRSFQNMQTLDFSFSTVKDKYVMPLLIQRHKLMNVDLSNTQTGQDFKSKLEHILQSARQRKKKRTLLHHNN